MSMFHELMMRKKEQIMYATIKGKLTESSEGVFTDFYYNYGDTNSKYLVTQETLSNFTSIEFVIKFKVPSKTTFAWQPIMSSSSTQTPTDANNIMILRANPIDGTLQFSPNFTYAQTNIITFSNKIQLNTWQWVKIVWKNGIYYLYLSSDGITFTLDKTDDMAYSIISNKYLFFGVNFSNGNTYDNSIDLNESYIKLGSTKYKLQAVVGYTIVGSPTITDGVVSGFSDSNYLKLGGTIKYSGTSNLEFYFRFKTATTMSGFTNVLSQGYSVGNTYKWRTIAQYSTTSTCNVGYGISSGSVEFYKALQPDTWYRVKFYAKNGVWVNETYNDDGTLFGSANKNFDFAEIERDFYIGANQANQSVFIQAVDLNNSYIKVNNKLWFNGQQA